MEGLTTVSTLPKGLEDDTFSGYQIIFYISHYTHIYIMGLVVALGIFGNVLSIVVFMRCKQRDLVTVTYLTPLAVADLVTLLYGAYSWMVGGVLEQSTGYFFIDPPFSLAPQVLCKLIRYVYRVASCVSSYIVVLFSLERCVGVWVPLKVHLAFTTGLRKTMIRIMILTCFIINIPVLVHFWVFPFQGTGFPTCFFYVPDFSNSAKYVLVQFISHVIPHALPCLLILIFSVLIILGVRRAKKEAAVVRTERKDNSSLLSLLLVALLYLVSTLPYLGMWGYLDYYNVYVGSFPHLTPKEVDALFMLGVFTISFSMLNYGFNFLIYACTLKIFKDELAIMARGFVQYLRLT